MMHVHAYSVTPFCSDNPLEVNIDGLRKNLTFLVENGVKVIVVGGGTGEVEMLSDDELRQIAMTAIETAGDRALIIPTVPDNLKQATTLLKDYAAVGFEVVLSMPPYIRHHVPEDLIGVFHYYEVLADAADVALLPYNTQGWPATFIGRLAEIANVIGIKDPCKQPYTLYEAIRLVGDRLVWIGNKRHQSEVLQYHFQAGIQGFTAGLINLVPTFELEMQEAGMRRDWDRLIRLQRTVAPLETLRDRYGDAAMLKGGLDLIGLTGGSVRPPRVNMPDEGRMLLLRELQRLGCV